MSKNTDETLASRKQHDAVAAAGITEETLASIRDVTDPDAMAEGTFNFAAFVSGAKPTRRAVTLYARGDLRARIDLLAEEADLAEKNGDTKRVAALRKEAGEVIEEMSAPGAVIDVLVEGRSSDWVEKVETALEKDGVTDETERTLRRVAAQIIAPEGVTYELLEQFRIVSEPQVKKLVVAATMANLQPIGIDVPFSRGSSAARSGRRS